ncbi:MAG: DUF1203 domain-containing protein [Pseudomonadota bacterium]
MDFQIKSLPASEFAYLFDLSDDELKTRKAVRQVVAEKPGTPCRVSMQDADVGDTVILVNYEHQPETTPYRASHAIFVREGAEQVQPSVNEVPDVIQSRLISLRCFDEDHMITHADVLQGAVLSSALSKVFDDDRIAYAHIHYAKPGCFAASVHRAG